MAAISKGTFDTATLEQDTTAKEYETRLRVVLLKIICDWSGDSKDAAIKAAMEFGKLAASQMLTPEDASKELRKVFVNKKVDESHWEDVSQTFEGTRAATGP